MQPTQCDKCHHLIEESEWPFCPHPVMDQGLSVKGDDIPGGMVLENLGPHPVRVYSHTERERLMKAAGLELKEKFCPMPGTDIDPAGIPNPKGYMDAYTMAAGAELICRNGQKDRPFDAVADGVIRNLTSDVKSQREMEEILAAR